MSAATDSQHPNQERQSLATSRYVSWLVMRIHMNRKHRNNMEIMPPGKLTGTWKAFFENELSSAKPSFLGLRVDFRGAFCISTPCSVCSRSICRTFIQQRRQPVGKQLFVFSAKFRIVCTVGTLTGHWAGKSSQFVSLPETNRHSPWKWTPGKRDSYWKPPFPGAMLVLGRVVNWFWTDSNWLKILQNSCVLSQIHFAPLKGQKPPGEKPRFSWGTPP